MLPSTRTQQLFGLLRDALVHCAVPFTSDMIQVVKESMVISQLRV